jgi:hypothetical protein
VSFSSKAKFLTVVLLGALAGGAAGCELQTGKVAQGQLYMSGEARYDAYFKDVHAIQVWAAQWPEDKRQTRRPLITFLDLTPDAVDVTIIQATHEKVAYLLKDGGTAKLETFVDDAKVTTAGPVHADPALFHAIEETAQAELQRAHKMNSMLPKLDELSKLGQSLEPHVGEVFTKHSPGKVSEVRNEVQASLTVLSQTTTKARRGIRECDDFVSDLQRAVGAVDHARRSDDKPDKPDKPEPPQKPEKPERPEKPAKPPPKHDAAPPPKPAPPVAKKDDTPKKADAPPPAAKPPPKQDGEVFNP